MHLRGKCTLRFTKDLYIDYTPYGCETAARAHRFIVEPTVSMLVSRF